VVVGALQLKQRKLVDVLLAGGCCHAQMSNLFVVIILGRKLSTFYSSYLCKINIWWCRHFKKKKLSSCV
jgi:hypothetical protein